MSEEDVLVRLLELSEAANRKMLETNRKLREKNMRLSAALQLCGVGGNHLANVLIGRLGGGFPGMFPVGSEHGKVRSLVSDQDLYEVWCCWDAIMRARDSANPIETTDIP